MLILRVSFSCILSKFYIKPQPGRRCRICVRRCILSKFYIKPQRQFVQPDPRHGLYLIEILHQTTTRGRSMPTRRTLYLIEILHQTTTRGLSMPTRRTLYLIEILHQTTTMPEQQADYYELYLIEILHQTTTIHPYSHVSSSCILSKFYIKPQPGAKIKRDFQVVSYRNSTSNHNNIEEQSGREALYLIEILHQTTTNTIPEPISRSCILSKFYIKPQQPKQSQHRTVSCILSKFYIKPQLSPTISFARLGCILSKFYIKPQHGGRRRVASQRCILSKFYIKPQQAADNHDHRRCCILSKFYIKPQL